MIASMVIKGCLQLDLVGHLLEGHPAYYKVLLSIIGKQFHHESDQTSRPLGTYQLTRQCKGCGERERD